MPGYLPSTQPYAQPADLLTYGMSATALSTPATSVAIQQQAILSASEEADSYLRQQFQLPLTQWGSDLVKHVCWIAQYTLINVRGYNPESAADANYETRYRLAISWLREVAGGRVTPDLISSASGAQQGAQDASATPSSYSPNQTTLNSLQQSTRGTGSR